MMEIVTKDFPVTAGEATDEYPHGTFEVILSAPTKDRDGEIVDSKAFEPLPDHITFDTDHSMTCDSVVGSGTPYYHEDGTLRVKGGYAGDERSQTIRQKVVDKHIRTTSVTFMSAERVADEKGVDHVVKAELLNGTFTPVPSNRESVVLSAKSLIAHEAAAIAQTRDAVMPEAAKSIVGSLEAQRDRVKDALDEAYPLRWVFIRGVLPASVVFDIYSEEDDHTWEQSYTDDGTTVSLIGVPTEVNILEVVITDSDTVEPAAKAAGSDAADEKAATEPAAEAADEGSVMGAKTALVEYEMQVQFGG
jgi:hypothetical protein